jgi:hypothetical protein
LRPLGGPLNSERLWKLASMRRLCENIMVSIKKLCVYFKVTFFVFLPLMKIKWTKNKNSGQKTGKKSVRVLNVLQGRMKKVGKKIATEKIIMTNRSIYRTTLFFSPKPSGWNGRGKNIYGETRKKLWWNFKLLIRLSVFFLVRRAFFFFLFSRSLTQNCFLMLL